MLERMGMVIVVVTRWGCIFKITSSSHYYALSALIQIIHCERVARRGRSNNCCSVIRRGKRSQRGCSLGAWDVAHERVEVRRGRSGST